MAKKSQSATRPPSPNLPQPHSALKRLDKLVGTWSLRGRTFDSKDDNITGKVVIEWLPGGFFMLQRGEINFNGSKIRALEIIGYDESTQDLTSTVYSDMSGVPFSYCWDVQGKTVIHSGSGARYTGTFSEDGNTLTGGWRPEEDNESAPENTYDAIMTRIK